MIYTLQLKIENSKEMDYNFEPEVIEKIMSLDCEFRYKGFFYRFDDDSNVHTWEVDQRDVSDIIEKLENMNGVYDLRLYQTEYVSTLIKSSMEEKTIKIW